MTQQVLSRHGKLTKNCSPKFVSSRFLNFPTCSRHCKRFVASSALSSAFALRTSPRQTDSHQWHQRSTTALIIINNNRCTALAMQLPPAEPWRGEQGSGTTARRCPPAPGRPGPQPGQGRARLGCCQALPHRQGFLPSSPSAWAAAGPGQIQGAGSTSPSRQAPSSPPTQVPAAPWHDRPSPLAAPRPPRIPRLPSPQPPSRRSRRPSPAPRHLLLLPPGRPHLHGGGGGSVRRRGSAGAAVPLPSRWPAAPLGARLLPSPGRGGATWPRGHHGRPWRGLPSAPGHRPGPAATPQRRGGAGILRIPRPFPLPTRGCCGGEVPAAAVPAEPHAHSRPFCQELMFCWSGEGGRALGKRRTASLSQELPCQVKTGSKWSAAIVSHISLAVEMLIFPRLGFRVSGRTASCLQVKPWCLKVQPFNLMYWSCPKPIW